ncbi:MAG: helix-hairpin-helix domain-containing protein [Bacteroides sp.]|nr:helix-hairpin-helix domain-containing protein [Bacteroides sp.]
MRLKSWLKEYYHYSLRERRGILLLAFIVVALFLVEVVYVSLWRDGTLAEFKDKRIPQDESGVAEYKAFMASLKEVKPRWGEDGNWEYDGYRKSGRSSSVSVLSTPIPFDPNTADSLTFLQLGLPGWMAGNILKYRRKGGVFREPEDFRKIYGLTEEQYQHLYPYITLQPREEPDRWAESVLLSAETDSARQLPVKYSLGVIVELNTADTTELKKIPGIGSGIARMIVNYREQLGGFCHIEQLREIRLDHTRLSTWFSIDSSQVRPINLNRASVEQLKRHPYFNFYQAKAIVEHRKREGHINSLKPFILLEEFTEADLERMRPYVCFE